jgi:dTMP kinase
VSTSAARSGWFVALEGVEGAGKSTQAARLAERLRAEGYEVVLVREPGGTPLAEEARRLVLHGHDMQPEPELFLYLVARADLVARVVLPALAAGRIVVADRYELSTRAYQAAGRGLDPALVRAALALATRGVMPDLYLVLDVPPATGRARQSAQGKSADRIERADPAFHERVAEAFRSAAGPHVVHLPAGGPPDTVHEAVWSEVQRRLPSHAVARRGASAPAPE